MSEYICVWWTIPRSGVGLRICWPSFQGRCGLFMQRPLTLMNSPWKKEELKIWFIWLESLCLAQRHAWPLLRICCDEGKRCCFGPNCNANIIGPGLVYILFKGFKTQKRVAGRNRCLMISYLAAADQSTAGREKARFKQAWGPHQGLFCWHSGIDMVTSSLSNPCWFQSANLCTLMVVLRVFCYNFANENIYPCGPGARQSGRLEAAARLRRRKANFASWPPFFRVLYTITLALIYKHSF